MPKNTGADAPRVLKQRFVLDEKLGSGGMGTVFRAKDLRKVEARDRNPYVAVKVLNNDFREHPEAFIALQREAAKSQALSHRNIVSIYDFDKDGDSFASDLYGGLDCDDDDPAVSPGTIEAWNGVDDNCVGGIDNFMVMGFSTLVVGTDSPVRLGHENGISSGDIDGDGLDGGATWGQFINDGHIQISEQCQ